MLSPAGNPATMSQGRTRDLGQSLCVPSFRIGLPFSDGTAFMTLAIALESSLQLFDFVGRGQCANLGVIGPV